MSMPLQFKDFDPRRSKQNSSYVSRLIWQNTGITCFIALLIFPVLLGVAVGYLFVLAGVTTFKKLTGKNNNQCYKEEYQRIKVVLGEEVVESSFPDSVSLNVQDGGQDIHSQSTPPQKYYQHRIVNQNGQAHNGYVKSYSPQNGRKSQDSEDDKTHARHKEYRSADDSDSSTQASMEDNEEKTEDEEKESKRKLNSLMNKHNKAKIIYDSPSKVMNTSMESNSEVPSPDGGTGGELGRLRFALHYTAAKNELQVNVIKATNLPIYDNKEGINPYVKLCLLPQQFCWQRTQIIENNPDPVYNESFVISGFSKERLHDYTLRFCVVNYHDHFTEKYADDVIGDIYLPLSSLNTIENKPTYSISKWMNLQHVAATKPEPDELGEVCVSLCFRPISGRLIVTLTKVRGLPKMQLDRTDPYVKLSLYCDGVRLSKANTRVKRKTLNPVFNEKFNFNVNSDQISLTTVVLKVVNHYDVNYGSGGSGGMGQVVLGYNSLGSGQEQWNSMLESPSRHIEKWHKIYRDNSM
ncbi:synaptotagmin-1 isoform X2 [Exaiptasia diaphana]|uniref:C2 domain-containing protein n=1 Tax=Exaiptasia diaphana TaxID=2652724 RepID=A0A913XIG9_EXADI|nr:synaptotagmin-1 isoform X2 [Exaiptasia diaphana]KXJ25983.1 Synaptotagmin-1 [Exaiptasia diaphana]